MQVDENSSVVYFKSPHRIIHGQRVERDEFFENDNTVLERNLTYMFIGILLKYIRHGKEKKKKNHGKIDAIYMHIYISIKIYIYAYTGRVYK